MDGIEVPVTWDHVPELMDDLRAMARSLLALEGGGQSLQQPTELVLTALRRQVPGGIDRNEVDWENVTWRNRAYFFGAAYQAMKRALIDHARRRITKRRIQAVQIEEINLENLVQTADERPEQINALWIALGRLRERHPDWADLVEHHYLSGYSWEEAARVMGVSERKARRDGERAKLLLHREITKILNDEDTSPEASHGIGNE